MNNMVKLTLDDLVSRAKQTINIVDDDGIVVATAGNHFYSSDKTVVAIELNSRSQEDIDADKQTLASMGEGAVQSEVESDNEADTESTTGD